MQKRYQTQSLAITADNAFIQTPSSSNWNIGNLDNEMDFWIYPVAENHAQNIIARSATNGGSTTGGWGFYNNGSASGYSFWMGSLANATPTFALANNAWQHVKFERTNGVLEVYVNGTLIKSNSQPGSFDTANPITIGASLPGPDNTFYIDEFRLSIGTSREIGNFSTPWTQYNGNLYQNFMNLNINTTLLYKSYPGNATVSNATPHYRTLQVENLTNATNISIGITFNPLFENVVSVLPNTSTYSNVIVTNTTIENTNGVVFFVISLQNGSGIQSLFNNRTSLVDTVFNYYNYTPDAAFTTTFTNATVTDAQHGTVYPITNFLTNYVTYLPWVIYPNFTATSSSVTVGQSVTFTDTSLGEPTGWTNWSWTFGDGGTASIQNPSYAYGSPGNYTVTLTSRLFANASITNSTSFSIMVTQSPPPAPIAEFNGTPRSVSLGSSVQFVDMSSNSPTSWTWNFGDSTGSMQQSPKHVYSLVGNYTVSLNASNAQGSNTLTKSNYIQVIPLAPPVASFTTNVSSGQPPLTVQFNDTSSNLPTSWTWDINFINGTDYYNSASQNPVVTFNSVGSYIVNFTAYNAAGNSSSLQTITVTNPSGFTRQDLTMIPFYTFKLTFLDSQTNQPIPIVTVLDSNGNNVTTSNGVFTETYPFSTIAIYASSDGYDSASNSYVIASSQNQTMLLTKSNTVSQTQFVATKTVRFLCQDYQGNPIIGMNTTAYATNTTLGSLDWVPSLFGINLGTTPILSTNMTGITGQDGSVSYVMLSTSKYAVSYYDPAYSINETRYYYPSETEYVETFYTETPTYSANNMNFTFYSGINKTNSSAVVGVKYTDNYNSTDNVTFTVMDKNHNIIYQTSVVPS